MRVRRGYLVTLALAVGAAALSGQDARARLPVIAPPPPIERALLERQTGPFRLVVGNTSFRTSLGARVRVPRAEIVGELPAGDEPIHIQLLRITRLDVLVPIDEVSTGFNPFIDFGIPRLHVDRVIVEDAYIAAQAAPSQNVGPWLYRFRDFDLNLNDIRIGGDGPMADALRLTRLDFGGDFKGDPFAITSATAAAGRTESRFTFNGDFGFGLSQIGARIAMQRNGNYDIAIDVDTMRFSELRPVMAMLPELGTGAGQIRIAKSGSSTTLTVPRFAAAIRESRIDARGRAVFGTGNTIIDDVRITSPRLRSEDVEAAFGTGLPGGGVWAGGVTADGAIGDRIRIDGELLQQTSAGVPSRLAVRGTVAGAERPRIDLTIEGDPLRVADTAFVATLTAQGPLDSIFVRGDVALVQALRGDTAAPAFGDVRNARAELEAWVIDPAGAAPRYVRGDAQIRARLSDAQGEDLAVLARAEGRAVLASGGAVDARVDVDSLPLDALPLPTALESVEGFASGRADVTGTIDAPEITGRIDIRGGAFEVPAAHLSVSELAGPVFIADGTARIDNITARANGGTLTLDGSARIQGERTLDVRLRADAVALPVDTPHVVAYADVRATGPMSRPEVRGTAEVRQPAAGNMLLARASGSVIAAADGAVHVDITGDSVPLGLIPAPEDVVRDLHGYARADVQVTGTVESPRIDGLVTLRDGGFVVARTNTEIDSLSGPIRIDDGVVVIDELRGRAGGGSLALSGSARLTGDRMIDMRLRADTVTAMDTDSAHVVVSATLTASGALTAPRIGGTVELHDGFVTEALLQPRKPLDPDSPPYAELVAEVPWLRESRLRRAAAAAAQDTAAGPTGEIALHVGPGFSIIDEDSDMYGVGDITVALTPDGPQARGIYRITGGNYNNFGERFDVVGGAFYFDGSGIEPAASLRAEHDADMPLGPSMGTMRSAWLERYPPIEVFAQGEGANALQTIRWPALVPYDQTDVGALLLYGARPQPVNGLLSQPFWLADDGGDMISKRSEVQSLSLLWAYIADEGYDYIPLSLGQLRAGFVSIGSEYPSRITASALMRAIWRNDRFEVVAEHAPQGGTAPGFRLRYRAGDALMFLFNEPRYSTAVFSGYAHRRRSGLGIRWEKSF